MAEWTAPVLTPGAVAWNDNMPAFEQFAFAPALPLEVEIAAHDSLLGTLQVCSPHHSFQEFRGNQYWISVTAIYSSHRSNMIVSCTMIVENMTVCIGRAGYVY